MTAVVKLLIAKFTVKTLPQAVRMIRIVVGFTLLLTGVILLVLPGPAVVVIPLALAILAGEFVWARRLLRKFDAGFRQLRRKTINGQKRT
jgi:tellurite resistance protein TerC